MVLVDDDQPYVPIDAAVEGEVRLLGVHPVVDRVVHRHGQGVVIRQHVGDILAEGGAAAIVGHDLLAVQRHLGGGVDPPELQVHPLGVGVKVGLGEESAVMAGAPPVAVAAVLAVLFQVWGTSTGISLPSGLVK